MRIKIKRKDRGILVSCERNDRCEWKTLGLNWQDILEFSITAITKDYKTKREVLSAISKLFDPLGLISPILIRA